MAQAAKGVIGLYRPP